MASSRLDCVLGVVRLISSASTMLVKSWPGLKTNSLFSGSQMLTPMTSDGSMSEVNCIRGKAAPMDRASAAASVVLPTHGTSSMRRCPRASRPTTASRMTSGLPTSARLTLCSSLRIRSVAFDIDVHYTLAARLDMLAPWREVCKPPAISLPHLFTRRAERSLYKTAGWREGHWLGLPDATAHDTSPDITEQALTFPSRPT